jgi:hypothetical protein
VPLLWLGNLNSAFFLDTYTLLILKLFGDFLLCHFSFGIGGARSTQSRAADPLRGVDPLHRHIC